MERQVYQPSENPNLILQSKVITQSLEKSLKKA